MEDFYHNPVLLKESIDLLDIKPDGLYVDVTFGGGGHSKEILKRLDTGRLFAFDRDKDAAANQPEDKRFVFIPEDFRFIKPMLHSQGIGQVDGILADLGVSSHQFDTPGRGFSFRFDGPLDMRMNTAGPTTAADILNNYSEKQLLEIFRVFGEVPNAKKLVGNIIRRRGSERIQEIGQFENIILDCIPAKRRSKYLAQVYQALRIEVNQEIPALQMLLNASLELIKPGGRLVVIAYHSLEDRFVKRFMRSGNLADKIEKDFYGNPLTPWKLITRRAIQPPEEEITDNPRARSARLRAAERKEEKK